VSFQVITTWKRSTDPDFEAKKNRILQLYGLMDGTDDVLDGDPEAVLVIDETGDLKKGITTVGMRRQYGRDLMREVYLAADNCSTRREPPFEQSKRTAGKRFEESIFRPCVVSASPLARLPFVQAGEP
jgi:hypothetical protein